MNRRNSNWRTLQNLEQRQTASTKPGNKIPIVEIFDFIHAIFAKYLLDGNHCTRMFRRFRHFLEKKCIMNMNYSYKE